MIMKSEHMPIEETFFSFRFSRINFIVTSYCQVSNWHDTSLTESTPSSQIECVSIIN